MRLEHGLCLRLFPGIERVVFGGLFERFTVRCTTAIAVDIEYLIQSEPGKKLLTAIAAMNNVKVAASEFLKPQGYAGHSSHERGVHHGAIRKINHKFTIPAVQHFARELLEVAAIEETTFSLHFDPYGRPSYPNLNRRVHSYSSNDTSPKRMLSNLPTLGKVSYRLIPNTVPDEPHCFGSLGTGCGSKHQPGHLFPKERPVFRHDSAIRD
jgi:hypothetical protein